MNNDIIDILAINGEVILDNAIKQSEIIREIPIIGNVVGILKVGLSIRDRIFAAKLIKFLNGFNNENTSEFIKTKDANKLGEIIIIALDKIEWPEKAECLGKLLKYCSKNNLDNETTNKLLKSFVNFDIDHLGDLKTLSQKKIVHVKDGPDLMINLAQCGYADLISTWDGLGLEITKYGIHVLNALEG